MLREARREAGFSELWKRLAPADKGGEERENVKEWGKDPVKQAIVLLISLMCVFGVALLFDGVKVWKTPGETKPTPAPAAGQSTLAETGDFAATVLAPTDENLFLAGLYIGMTEVGVIQKLGEPVSQDIDETGKKSFAGHGWPYKVFNYPGLQVTLVKYYDESGYDVDVITVLSRSYPTAKKIVIGDTQEKVKAAYGEREQWEDKLYYQFDMNHLYFYFESGKVVKIELTQIYD